MKNTIKVLVVDDSAVVRDFLVYIFSSEPNIHVVGTARNGKEAVELAKLKKPDIISMDIEMPVMNGMEATQVIMSTNPVPVILVTSSYRKDDVAKTFKAMEAGALAILEKPAGFGHPNYEKTKKELVNTLLTMSEVKVVTRFPKYAKKEIKALEKEKPVNIDERKTKYQIVAIGVSTGGPQVLQQMIPLIPAGYDIPIVIVQHIPQGFLEGMVDWLNQTSKLEIKIVQNGEKLEGGRIYFCPAEWNVSVNSQLRAELRKDVPGITVCPSVSHFFRSVSKNLKHQAIGVLLTGMGKDGSAELLLMKEAGAVTIVQDEKSCVVFGMPGEAFKLNAHKYILPPIDIVKKIVELQN